MVKQRYFLFLILQTLVIIAVTIIFKTVPDRQIAATIAGLLFISLPTALMAWEIGTNGYEKKIWFAAALQFLILFALPIMAIRLLNWNVPFERLTIFGVTGPFLHEWSSRSYLVWMIITLFTLLKTNQALKAKK